MKAKAPLTYVAKANRYARGVVAGKIHAGKYVRAACQRHLDGLRLQREKGYPYRLDEAKANRVCGFIELCPHVKGKWARDAETIHLEDWQCFIEVNVFGWVRKKDGLRRFRRVYIEVPRKNAKSTTTAATGLYMFAEDGEHGAEVYSGATTEKQAWEVFGPARLMAKNTPEMLEQYGIGVGAKNLHIAATASKFEPIIGKPGDGASPSFSITDEYHEHATPEQYDTMVTGMGAREQPIAWVITTAGSDTAGPCYALRQQTVDMLEGTVDNDELFAVIYTIDEDDDWTDAAVLAKANPNIGISVFREFLETEQRNAINDPRQQSKFKTKHLNVWVTASAPYFNLELWNRLADPSLTPERFRGAGCFAGLDLASKLDLCAKVLLFPHEVDGVTHYSVIPRLYCPKARIHAPENRHYFGWAEQKHVVATPGDITDYDAIEADVKADLERHRLLALGSDPYNATQLLTHFQATIGADKVIEVPQTVAHLSEPMKELQALIVAGRIHHDGNPALAWMIGNVTAQEDRNQNVFPRKEFPEKKIDGAVALIIAIGRALAQPDEVSSVYETRGVRVL
ncbi:MAG: terminase large subunit [Gemmatimonadaceae bacterium]|nr:terminase large subunit [Gemmatimonadaceae bacterium]